MADFKNIRIPDAYFSRVLQGEAYLLEDGGMGTILQEQGLLAEGTLPEELNLTHAEDIIRIQKAYVDAGSQLITTNTFGANRLKLGSAERVKEVFAAAARNARAAGARYVAGDVGPTGALLEPMGTLSFDEAYAIFAEEMDAIAEADCDVIIIETMADLLEAKAALLAALERTELPVFVTMTFQEDGRTFLGTPPEVAAATLSALGAHAVGINCSVGPREAAELAARMTPHLRCPLIVKPNAGMPQMVDGKTCYNMSADDFAEAMKGVLDAGATIVGGCCGTSPEFIEKINAHLVSRQDGTRAAHLQEDAPAFSDFTVTSASQTLMLPQGSAHIAVIGERINPTGKKKLQAALRAQEWDYLVGEAHDQEAAGADILDVNCGLPDIDEPSVLSTAVQKIQETTRLPLQIDSSDPVAAEAAARVYAGKPLINSVNGKQSNLDAILPLVKRYGCAVVGLTLDEDGIPPTAEERLAIARRIVDAAAEYGIPKCDVVIDCLVMAAATNQDEVREILKAVTLVKQQLGVRTVLGVSNVSFGMPQRNMLNSTFLAAAFGAGLDMPILNPLSARYRDTVASYRVLCGQDAQASAYTQAYGNATDPYDGTPAQEATAKQSDGTGDSCPVEIPEAFADAREEATALVNAVVDGRGPKAAQACLALLEEHDPIAVINCLLVPALDVVGLRYDAGTIFLPQLMGAAEAAKAAFDEVRAATADSAASAPEGPSIVLATVEGDIHDIGKNIVRMLLENYGYHVIDLGRDVTPEEIVEGLRASGAKLLGLSALMTTTVKAMERTVQLVHEQLPGVAVMVGGAVLTEDYAKQINADFYGKDAAASARIAAAYFGG